MGESGESEEGEGDGRTTRREEGSRSGGGCDDGGCERGATLGIGAVHSKDERRLAKGDGGLNEKKEGRRTVRPHSSTKP